MTAGFGFSIKDVYNTDEFADTYHNPININTRFVPMLHMPACQASPMYSRDDGCYDHHARRVCTGYTMEPLAEQVWRRIRHRQDRGYRGQLVGI